MAFRATLLAMTFTLAWMGAAAWAENIVFPDDSGVVDITKPPYNARGDGTMDCTDAIQKALIERGGVIYFPNGVYLVSDTLYWPGRATRMMFQGQSREGAILKLKDRCAGFGSPSSPRPVIVTGYFPPQRFRNAIRNLTVDTGTGNDGAIGIRFNASNQGHMHTVAIRSGDGRGVIGLDMAYTGDVGPLLVKDLVVTGFDVGILTGHATAAQTLEFITVKNQNCFGFVNDGQALAIRKFTSVNTVPALWNKRGSGMITLLEADLTGGGESAKVPAIINESGLYARNVVTRGYRQAIDGRQGSGRSVESAEAAEFTSHAPLSLFDSPSKALGLPVEETPEVPWDAPAEWVSVTKFEPRKVMLDNTGKVVAKGREAYDWTDAIQQAIDSGATTIYFPRANPTKQPYTVLGTVHIRNKVRRIIGMEGSFNPLCKPVFQLDDGEAPAVVVEQFELLYTRTTFKTNSKRTLVLRGLNSYLDVGPGGRVFVDDSVCHFRMAKDSKVWIRQWNTEYTHEDRHNVIWPEHKADVMTHPGNLNDGGTFWALGIKTEGDGTLLTTLNGGRSEVMGALVYTNKNGHPTKRAFVVKDSSLSLSLGEWVGRSEPFNMLEETRDGQTRTLKPGVAPGRGGGGLYVLVNAYPGRPDAPAVAAPAAPAVVSKGSGLTAEYFEGLFGALKATQTTGFLLDPKNPALAGLKDWSVRLSGQIEPHQTGVHRFSTDVGDCRLIVGETVVLDAWRNGARYKYGGVYLEAGRKYDIKFEARGRTLPKASAWLRWSEPGQKGDDPQQNTQLYARTSPPPGVKLSAAKTSLSEADDSVEIIAQRTGDTSAPLTVNLAAKQDFIMSMVMRFNAWGNAVEQVDYAPIARSITIPAGQTQASMTVKLINDKHPEPTRTLELEPALDARYDVMGGAAEVAIADDDMPPAGQGAGLQATYFATPAMDKVLARRVDKVIQFNWDKTAPVPGIDMKKGFAVRWEGQIQPLFSETYRLVLDGSDYAAMRVWVDGQQVIAVSNVGEQPKGKFGEAGKGLSTARIALQAGRKHDLKVEYVGLNFYGQGVRLLWSSDSQYEQVIPLTQLYPASAPASGGD